MPWGRHATGAPRAASLTSPGRFRWTERVDQFLELSCDARAVLDQSRVDVDLALVLREVPLPAWLVENAQLRQIESTLEM